MTVRGRRRCWRRWRRFPTPGTSGLGAQHSVLGAHGGGRGRARRSAGAPLRRYHRCRPRVAVAPGGGDRARAAASITKRRERRACASWTRPGRGTLSGMALGFLSLGSCNVAIAHLASRASNESPTPSPTPSPWLSSLPCPSDSPMACYPSACDWLTRDLRM